MWLGSLTVANLQLGVPVKGQYLMEMWTRLCYLVHGLMM